MVTSIRHPCIYCTVLPTGTPKAFTLRRLGILGKQGETLGKRKWESVLLEVVSWNLESFASETFPVFGFFRIQLTPVITFYELLIEQNTLDINGTTKARHGVD
jgi:hypothetical protein